MAYILTPITDPDNINTSWVDNLNGTYDTSEVHIDAVNKTFYFKGAGNLASEGSGVTGQALYSFFKDRWQNVDSITKYDFPMLSITNEQFEFIDGWEPDDSVTVTQGGFTTTTRKMIRTAGWAETTGTTVKRRYSGIVTLGSLGTIDQPYFAQSSSFVASTTDTTYTGPVNEAVKIYAYASGTDIAFVNTTKKITSTTTDLSVFNPGDIITVTGSDLNNVSYTVDSVTSSTELVVLESPIEEVAGAATLTTNYAATFNIYVRTRGKIYADSNLLDIGVTTMTYIVYRFPVSNADDLKLETTADTEIDANSDGTADVGDYADIIITYLPNPKTGTGTVNIRGAYGNGVVYALGDVVFDTGNSKTNADGARWYYADTAATSNGVNMNADIAVTWVLWATGINPDGERYVKDGFYAFHTIIDVDNDNTAGEGKANSPFVLATGASKYEVYDWCQWALRQDTNIDTGLGRKGSVASLLAEFVGDTLHTLPGVFIDDLDPVDTNNVVFHDYANGNRLYPLVVTVTLNFNSYLSTDASAKFYAYYKDPDGVGTYEFGSTGALQVVKSPSGNVGSDISNLVPDGATGSSYQFAYAYDNDSTGGRTVSTSTDIIVVAIGLSTGQYVKAEGTITSTGASVSLVAPLERNYSNPA